MTDCPACRGHAVNTHKPKEQREASLERNGLKGSSISQSCISSWARLGGSHIFKVSSLFWENFPSHALCNSPMRLKAGRAKLGFKAPCWCGVSGQRPPGRDERPMMQGLGKQGTQRPFRAQQVLTEPLCIYPGPLLRADTVRAVTGWRGSLFALGRQGHGEKAVRPLSHLLCTLVLQAALRAQAPDLP